MVNSQKSQVKKLFIVIFISAALFLISSGMILSVCAEESQNSKSAVITVTKVQVNTGDELSVEISISNNPGIAGHKFIFLYDTERLEYTGGENTEVGAGNVVLPIDRVNYQNQNSGRIVVIGYDVNDSDKNGLLFTLKFKITGGLLEDSIDSIDSSDFWLICRDLKNVSNDNIVYTIEQGKVFRLGFILNEDENYTVGWANIDNGDKTVYMQVAGNKEITIESFKNIWGADIKIEYDSGGEVDEEIHPLLGTGMKIIKGDEIIVVVIKNDLNEDGKADIEDAQIFLEFLVGNTILERAYALAVKHYNTELSAIRKLRTFLTAVL